MMNTTKNAKLAEDFCKYIRILAEKPENLDNLECYLSIHFSEWLERFANTPATLVCEMREFATMEI